MNCVQICVDWCNNINSVYHPGFSLSTSEFMVIEPKTQSYFEEGFLVQTP